MITGPLKFDFKTGDINRTAMAFWCVMMPRTIFDEIGLLDEVFSPGTGEDGDFCIKAVERGHELVQIPIDISHTFGDEPPEYKRARDMGGLPPEETFPIYHKGSATFGPMNAWNIIERNKQILDERYGNRLHEGYTMTPKYSIVIPTYNHCDDLLKPCIESIIEFTDLDNVEVIIVANGCTDNTREYVESLNREVFKLVWIDEPSGYTKSTNEGIKVAKGEYVVLLNNDTQLLHQEKNKWLKMLEAPFLKKKEIGLVGPLELFDNYSDHRVLIFFCVMIKKEVFDKIGLLDETFSPGGGEDIDFTIRANQAGYESYQLTQTVYNGSTNIGDFPIWHRDNKTFGEIPIYTNWIVKRNGLLNCLRYNKNIKLNLGSGGEHIPGYLSVDLHDRRAHIPMDARRLEIDGKEVGPLRFADNSVTEILASHLFEHLNPFHVIDVLKEWYRVLKPGGKLVMELPDIEELCRRFGPATKGERFGILGAVYGVSNTFDPASGMNSSIVSPHLYGWYPSVLRGYLSMVGFDNVGTGPEQIPHPESNFRIEGTKPRPTTEPVVFEYPLQYDNPGPLPETDASTITRLLNTNPVVKLNLGSGGVGMDGFFSVDLYDPRADIHMDIGKLKFPENSVKEIVASHVWEHLNPYAVQGILEQWFRTLKPGGRLIMEMPDIEAVMANFGKAPIEERWGLLNVIYGTVNTNGIGGPDNITSPHLFGWWREGLYDYLAGTGFVNIRFMDEQWKHPGYNFRVEADKPIGIDHKTLREREPMIYHEIFETNNYAVEDSEIRDRLVIDIGANVGYFALYAMHRGAAGVLAVEAQNTVFGGLKDNVEAFSKIMPLNYAVTDRMNDLVYLENNHVGSTVNNRGLGEAVITTTLEALVHGREGTPMVLKMDCEGSEFDIIMNAPASVLKQFETIYIEMHNNTHPNPEYQDAQIIRDRLSTLGFVCTYRNDMHWFDPVGRQGEFVATKDIPVSVEKWKRI